MNTPVSLATIEDRARAVAAARDALATELNTLKARIDALKVEAGDSLRAHLRTYNSAEAELRQVIEAAPQLFQKPRTLVLHGLKVGYQKGKGGLSIEDEARTVALIRKHLADQADVLIRVTEKPAKDAIGQLSVADLKRIGVHVVDAGDEIVLRPIEGDLDKLIKALTGDSLLTEDGP